MPPLAPVTRVAVPVRSGSAASRTGVRQVVAEHDDDHASHVRSARRWSSGKRPACWSPDRAVDQLLHPGGGHRYARRLENAALRLFRFESLRHVREVGLDVDRGVGFAAPAVGEGADVDRVVAEGVQEPGHVGLGVGVVAGDDSTTGSRLSVAMMFA
jgi:hypothetical protein